jgi:hypothetical protein
MQLLFLILSISFIHSKQVSHKCITISNTICGTDIQVVQKTFPNSSVFDSTVLSFIHGQDTQKLLSNYSGCIVPDVRYSKSVWCYFIKYDQSTKCINDKSKSHKDKKLCTSTCDAMVKSLQTSFNDKSLCDQSAKFKEKRGKIANTLNGFCKNSTMKSDCILSVPDEINNCGFSLIEDAKEYCKSSDDICCSDLSFKEEIMTPITPHESVCEFLDFNCWDTLKIGVAVGLVVLVVGLMTISFRFSRKKEEDQMDISVPVPSNDHDYTTLVKELPEPLNHVWYDSASSENVLSTDSYASSESSESSISTASTLSTASSLSLLRTFSEERDKKSVSDLFDRGYKIYVAKEDYFSDDSSRLTVHKGDQVVIKEVLSDEFGVGVNLNSTDEGVILLSRLNGL